MSDLKIEEQAVKEAKAAFGKAARDYALALNQYASAARAAGAVPEAASATTLAGVLARNMQY